MRRAALAALLAGALLSRAARDTPAAPAAPAAERVTVTGPAGDTLRDATPTFVVRAADFAAADKPLQLTLEISERADFAGPLLAQLSATGDSARLTFDRLLPEDRVIFWRARARTPGGREVLSDAVGPRTTAKWLVLVAPNSPVGAVVDVRRPRFVWRSVHVTTPPGPWTYDLTIQPTSVPQPLVYRNLADTTFTPPTDLESNTSYRWAVDARVRTGESTRASSVSSFVIADPTSPPVTLLYQNFPNPFPTATATKTCIWFDLRRSSTVSLDVLDLRGRLVRTIVTPGQELPAGRYGRGNAATGTGCDARYTWDGTADNGMTVPDGVYLIRLRADATESLKKAVFRGR